MALSYRCIVATVQISSFQLNLHQVSDGETTRYEFTIFDHAIAREVVNTSFNDRIKAFTKLSYEINQYTHYYYPA